MFGTACKGFISKGRSEARGLLIFEHYALTKGVNVLKRGGGYLNQLIICILFFQVQ